MQTEAVGKQIKKFRAERGYSQKEFATKSNITPNYLSAVERGVKVPSLNTFIRIAKALCVSADDLLEDALSANSILEHTRVANILESLPEKETKKILNVVEVMLSDIEHELL